MPSLLINVYNDDERLVPIVEESTFVGRDPANQVVIEHPTVSRNHVEILVNDSEWFVKDLGSRNGTVVDGAKLGSEPLRLTHGAELLLGGDRVRINFLSE
ncbi:MAG: FHA domain-containing protein, partial [Dehalococcoidia bacterium]